MRPPALVVVLGLVACGPPPGSERPHEQESDPAPEDSTKPAPEPEPLALHELDGLRVRRLEIRGVSRELRGRITAAIGTRQGRPASREQISRDVRVIYGLGQMRAVRVEAERDWDGVLVRFWIEQRPRVAAIRFEGNRAVASVELRAHILHAVGQPHDPVTVVRDVGRILDHYRYEGYLDVEVEAALEDGAIVFAIDEGPRVTVASLDFRGNQKVSDKELQALAAKVVTVGGPHVTDRLDRLLMHVAALYMDRGYINARAGTPEVKRSADGTSVDVTIPVTEGRRYRVGKLALRSDAPLAAPDAAYLAELGIQQGAVFSRLKMMQGLDAVRDFHARAAGIKPSRVIITPESRVDPDKRTVDVTLVIAVGPPP